MFGNAETRRRRVFCCPPPGSRHGASTPAALAWTRVATGHRMHGIYIVMAVVGGLWGAGAAVIALHSAGLVAARNAPGAADSD